MNHTFVVDTWLRDRIHFVESYSEIDFKGRIVFLLNPLGLNIKSLKDIPVVFANQETDEIYSIIHDNLVFHQDIIKSAFYLLSGSQEIDIEEKDFLGRFPYKHSLQFKYKFIDKPIVNYYFSWVYEAIRNFYRGTREIKARVTFSPFCFNLTHDVDRIKYYTLNNILYKIKEVIGLKEGNLTKMKDFQRLLGLINGTLFKKKDPFWNFEELMKFELSKNIKSTYFLLNQRLKHQDSYYRFEDKEIKELLLDLIKKDNEIGLHGNPDLIDNFKGLKDLKVTLEDITGNEIIGIRNHRLTWDPMHSPSTIEKAGFYYDQTLGFAEHEGFRNSYCLPFRIYDFKNDRMSNIWEIPLNLMDATLFHYQKYTVNEAYSKIRHLIQEIKNFNGVFSMLWHNHYFDEIANPGISNFYKEIIEFIVKGHPQVLLSKEILMKSSAIKQY